MYVPQWHFYDFTPKCSDPDQNSGSLAKSFVQSFSTSFSVSNGVRRMSLKARGSLSKIERAILERATSKHEHDIDDTLKHTGEHLHSVLVTWSRYLFWISYTSIKLLTKNTSLTLVPFYAKTMRHGPKPILDFLYSYWKRGTTRFPFFDLCLLLWEKVLVTSMLKG